MAVSFQTPPLVELIAELRWIPGGIRVPASNPNSLEVHSSVFTNPRHEELYMRFGSLVASKGYAQVERLVPIGVPAIPFQPVYRYKSGPEAAAPTLYQLGLGIFSANTVPPYKSWNEFRPVVEQGVTALVEVLSEKGTVGPFTSVMLRYIDGFNSRFTSGQSVEAFLRDSLGIAVTLPPALTSRVAEGRDVKPQIHLSIPLTNGMTMSLGMGEGQVDDETAVIMDTSVARSQPVPADVGSVMSALDDARSVIHDSFIELTSKLHQLMKPMTLDK